MFEDFVAGLIGKQRWSVADIAKDLAAKLAADAVKVARRLANQKADAVIERELTRRLAARLAKRTEDLITEFGGAPEQRAQLAGALAVNGGLAAVAYGQAFARLCSAQGALELARGTDGERAAREEREAAEAACVAAFVELSRLAPAETAG
jgi:hypothetical protein